MESIKYIMEKLREFSVFFPNLEFRYEYRYSIHLHIIEVNPDFSFKNDTLYIDSEIQFEEEFSRIFPAEEILFISEDSLTKIKDPILELGGTTSTDTEKMNYSLTMSFSSFFAGSMEDAVFNDCEDYSLAA